MFSFHSPPNQPKEVTLQKGNLRKVCSKLISVSCKKVKIILETFCQEILEEIFYENKNKIYEFGNYGESLKEIFKVR